jgi:type I restriction enzyme, R subunit
VATSPNFAFLQQQFPQTAESATLAERHIHGDPRGSCFHARHALERLVVGIYRLDRTLRPPAAENLYGYLYEPAFRTIVPEAVWQKADYIRDAGNVAVHGKKTPKPEFALQLVRELAHVLYWAGRTYLRKGAEALQDKVYDESLIPQEGGSPSTTAELEQLKAQLDAKAAREKELEGALKAKQDELAAIKAENAAVPDTHDYDEAATRRHIIDLALHRAGWPLDRAQDREYEVRGMPNDRGIGYADYVLWGDDGKPLAVVEAKRTTVDAKKGKQQAKLYADCLEQMHGRRPIIFYTNGYQTHLWDDLRYPPRKVSGFYTKDELQSLIVRRNQRQPIDVAKVNNAIVERYYQKRAIGSIGEHFTSARRKALLVMATGTGKTRTAIALVDLLQRAGWVKRVLFLADRVSLVRQAVNAFKKHLPESSPVNLVTEKDKSGRVYVCTYPTMMGLIDESDDGQARFGVGHFDLLIVDEAHRSVYQKYRAIFAYFDSLLVGLTATPREQIDRNTYELFDLAPGVPTDAYELDTAVADGFLVPPKVKQVDLKFPRQGIDYDSLPEDEKEQWESLDWGDKADEGGPPERVSADAINQWLFNRDTVDKMLRVLMLEGHKVAGGDRLAKTIVFARNHKHAEFLQERFDHHYPEHAGHFARVIDNYENYAQSLLDDFSQKDKEPHIAFSVDMLDTGIDVPEVANLAFFKPVYSKIKFWQMIGRGTRLCPDLFGPGEDKLDFRVFDFCFNFDFFRQNPNGIESSGQPTLGTQLFRARVELLGRLQEKKELDDQGKLGAALADGLHREVGAMNQENFIVRMELEQVQRWVQRRAWEMLTPSDRIVLCRQIAGLPTQLDQDDIESRLFDLLVLRMQLSLADEDAAAFESRRQRVLEIAFGLEDKRSIPAVAAQLDYLAQLQGAPFWDGISVQGLEELRLRLRGLVPFLDKAERKIVYTDFQDQVQGIREVDDLGIPRMTGVQYERKVQEYLRNHLNHIVIQRLRTNQPLTDADLKGLERTLAEIGEGDGETLLTGMLTRNAAPTLAHFVRKMVGMDRSAAQAAFSRFLSDRSLTPQQIRFVEMVIDQLTARGVMEASALYEPPFSGLHAGGPDELFRGKQPVIEGIFESLREAHRGLPAAGA